MSETTPRIPGLAPEQWSDEVRRFLDVPVAPGISATRGDFNSPRMLVNHLPLARAWLGYVEQVAHGHVLPARLREIAILRTTWVTGCGYEWLHHIFGAAPLGLTAAHVAALQGEADDPVWTPLEAMVVRLADRFGEGGEIEEAVHAGLAEALDHAQLLELLFVTGTYRMLCWIENSARVPLDAGMLEVAKAQGLPLLPGMA